jgi:hypothetical protein
VEHLLPYQMQFNPRNDVPYHVVHTVAPTPQAWLQLLIELISTQCYEGITWSNLLKLLQRTATSRQSSYNCTTNGYFPASLAVAFHIPDQMTDGFHQWLFQLLKNDGYKKKDLKSKQTVYTIIGVEKDTTNDNHAGSHEWEPCIDIFKQDGSPLTLLEKNALTLERCIQLKLFFRSSLYRRRLMIMSPGLNCSMQRYAVSNLKHLSSPRMHGYAFDLYKSGGKVVVDWRKKFKNCKRYHFKVFFLSKCLSIVFQCANFSLSLSLSLSLLSLSLSLCVRACGWVGAGVCVFVCNSSFIR